MKQINIALLGLGRIGKIHLKNIQQHFPEANVMAVADPLYDEKLFQQQYPGVALFSDAADAISHEGVNTVLVCTPTSSHADLIEKAIKKGKHIFCEKPMDLSLERTQELSEMADAAGIKLMLGFNRRFDPDFLTAYNSVRAGRIGELQIVKITSRDPGLPPVDYIKNSGGLFMDMAIHDFDMARYIMGKEVTEVFSKGLVLIDEMVAEAGDIDTALTTLTFADGTYAVIDNSRKAIYGYDQRLEIFGSGGMIQVENNQHHRNVVYDEKGIHQALPLDFFMDRYTNSYLKEMEFFIEALIEDKPVPADGADALEATRIAFAAMLSVKTGLPVKMSEIRVAVKDTVLEAK